jgi:hypothetical protein
MFGKNIKNAPDGNPPKYNDYYSNYFHTNNKKYSSVWDKVRMSGVILSKYESYPKINCVLENLQAIYQLILIDQNGIQKALTIYANFLYFVEF